MESRKAPLAGRVFWVSGAARKGYLEIPGLRILGFFFWGGGDGSSSFSTGPLDRARLPLPVLPRPPCCFPGQVVAGLGFVTAGGRESQPPGGKEANTPRLKQNVEMQSCLNLVPQWKLKQNALHLCVLLRLRAAAFPRATSAGEYWPPTPHVPKTPAS